MAPASTPDADDTDRLVHWLLGSLSLRTTVFHVGQYCGRWRASTAGRSRASFHLVLQGRCWLHRPGRAPQPLAAGDALFLLRDEPHFIGPSADAADALAGVAMQALHEPLPGGTGLACGFFDFEDALGALLVAAFPGPVRLPAASDRALAQVFELLLAQSREEDPERPSPLLGRLTELLFFYAMRQALRDGASPRGLWALAAQPPFSRLLEALLREPGADWSLSRMAALTCLSRAAFCRRFAAACGVPPAQFLLQLRMQVAARRLQAGDSVERAADHVGYRSNAAFARAFHKVLGEQPGAWRRRHRPDTAPALH